MKYNYDVRTHHYVVGLDMSRLGFAPPTMEKYNPCPLKEICPRGNNKVVIYISIYHDKCLLFMLELY